MMVVVAAAAAAAVVVVYVQTLAFTFSLTVLSHFVKHISFA